MMLLIELNNSLGSIIFNNTSQDIHYCKKLMLLLYFNLAKWSIGKKVFHDVWKVVYPKFPSWSKPTALGLSVKCCFYPLLAPKIDWDNETKCFAGHKSDILSRSSLCNRSVILLTISKIFYEEIVICTAVAVW